MREGGREGGSDGRVSESESVSVSVRVRVSESEGG